MKPSSTDLMSLGRTVADALDETRRQGDGLTRVRSRLTEDRKPRPAAPLVWRTGRLAVAAAAVTLLASASMLRTSVAPPLAVQVGSESGATGTFVAADHRMVPLSFSDGSTMRVMPQARVRLVALDAAGARVALEQGRLEAHVARRSAARWSVIAGPYEVRVTGTRFSVEWDGATQSLEVDLAEGGVIVEGCGLVPPRVVAAGERLRVECAGPKTAERDLPAPVAEPSLPDRVEDRRSAPEPVEPRPKPPPAPSVAQPASTPSEMFREAMAARRAGEVVAAQSRLMELRRRHGASPEATRAAFELGRIAFDVDADLMRAAEWFDSYLREAPSGPLARESLGRALEARVRLADAERARLLARRYEREFPEGPHARLAAKVLAGEVP